MDKSEALSIIKQARESLISEGLLFPEILPEDVKIISTPNGDTPMYSRDWDIREEHLYSKNLIKLEKKIFAIMDREWRPLDGGFWIHYDENFTKEVPSIWREKSREENASKNITDSTLKPGSKPEKDEFRTFQEDSPVNDDVPVMDFKTPDRSESETKQDYEIILDGEELPETDTLTFNDDTYIEIPD